MDVPSYEPWRQCGPLSFPLLSPPTWTAAMAAARTSLPWREVVTRGRAEVAVCARRRGGERPVDEQGDGAHRAGDECGGAWRCEPVGVGGFGRGLLLLPWRTGTPARPRTSASSSPSSPRATAASMTLVE